MIPQLPEKSNPPHEAGGEEPMAKAKKSSMLAHEGFLVKQHAGISPVLLDAFFQGTKAFGCLALAV